MESSGDRQIVLRSQRRPAQFGEARPRHAAHRPLHPHLTAQHRQGDRLLGLAPLEVRPQAFEPGPRRLIQRREPDRGSGHAVQTEVARPRRLHHLATLPQDVDEGRKELAVDAVLVEVLRRAVRGDGQHHPLLEQGVEQPAQDHGVGDVGDLQLVKAQQPGLRGDQARNRRNGIVALVGPEHGLARPGVALAPLFHQIVDAGHEGVEMGAHLLLFRRGRVEEVHQHGLAAPRRSPDVDALHLGRAAEQALLRQIRLQPLQRGQQLQLLRIGGDDALFDADVVGVTDTGGHGQRHSPTAPIRKGEGASCPLKQEFGENWLLRACERPKCRTAFLPSAPTRIIQSWAIASPSLAPPAMSVAK